MCLPAILSVWCFFKLATEASTIYDSPYVSFSPDNKAWTTNAKDTDYTWYPESTVIDTGIKSSLREAGEGEHYYISKRSGEIPVGKWEVVHRNGVCTHTSYPSSQWHNISFRKSPCFKYYYSGWNAYCADCGEKISDMLFYMSSAAAGSLKYLEAGMGKDYYYLCPWCQNLEQGRAVETHYCKAVSYNQYKVHYDANTFDLYSGYMTDSRHMYNNAGEYEGEKINASNRLSKNNYSRLGYVFTGWNTKPDGSGKSYSDGEKILNLTTADCNTDSKNGTVILYAMWKISESSLVIDPAGGMYDGQSGLYQVTGQACSVYNALENMVTPPDGSMVSFETGTEEKIQPIRGTMHFKQWRAEDDFLGTLEGTAYRFPLICGNVDVIIAEYEPDSIVLPDIYRSGWSFGGWYYDENMTLPAGDAGDEIIPSKDMTLYAKWVELKLFSQDNYTAYAGKGAVDLSWEQPDSKEKTYKLYQKCEDDDDWKLINTASDISNKASVQKNFSYTAGSRSYTAEYTGFYTITANGAQGGSYKNYGGGAGGRVSAKVWLYEGEKVTFTVGGSNGYNYGGTAKTYANGGGCTIISTNLKGTLLIAGGGGGASIVGSGKAGGSTEKVITTQMSGESGETGGGGGLYGGKAGEVTVHSHTNACYRNVDTDILTQYASKKSSWSYDYAYKDDEYPVRVLAYGMGDAQTYRNALIKMGNTGFPSDITPYNQIPTGGATSLRLELYQNCTVGNGCYGDYLSRGGVAVYDQNGKLIFSKTNNGSQKFTITRWQDYDGDGDKDNHGVEWGPVSSPYTYHMTYNDSNELISSYSNLSFDPGYDNTVPLAAAVFGATTYANMNPNWYGSEAYYIIEDIALPAGTTAITVISEMQAADVRNHTFYALKLSGERKLKCGYTEGQIVSSQPAYGGSNYVNKNYTTGYSDSAGKNTGNGSASIVSEEIGYTEGLKLNAVSAYDRHAPNPVEISSVKIKALEERKIQVVWGRTEDVGTVYYHKAESYAKQSTQLLCVSNITSDTLTAGLAGYYYTTDRNENTMVLENNGQFTADEAVEIDNVEKTMYLHIAPVDKAGNIGDTIHIRIAADKDVAWNLYTEKLMLVQGDNVYESADKDSGEKIYYVRCDGTTPFTINYEAYMLGQPSENYQINYAVLQSEYDGNSGENRIVCLYPDKSADLYDEECNIYTESSNNTLLSNYPYTVVQHPDNYRRLKAAQKFILEQNADGVKICIIPRAGAILKKDGKEEVYYSDKALDYNNQITIIGDMECPVVDGIGVLEQMLIIDRDDGDVTLEIKASDTLSGLKEFNVTITNTDNMCEQTWKSDESGIINMDITRDEPLFSGDMLIHIYASDNVGNEITYDFSTTEFALWTDVNRILEPHEPVFQAGESGMLTIKSWGYADRIEVEFPGKIVELNPDINMCIDYTDIPDYVHVENLQFMIPLYTPDGTDYEITVRAYKGDKMLEQHPRISVVGVSGTVLDDFRTRLR
jgi:hypothetical protein